MKGVLHDVDKTQRLPFINFVLGQPEAHLTPQLIFETAGVVQLGLDSSVRVFDERELQPLFISGVE